MKVIEQEEEQKEAVKIEIFDFNKLKNEPDIFPHIRVIGKTGVGKTRLTEWIMDFLGDEQFVVTPKKKPDDWTNHKVFGYPFNYSEIESKLQDVHTLMYKRYQEMEKGNKPHMINFVCDEWKLINNNISSAKELMKDIIIVARDSKIRLIALAQGENVKTWGFEGESDLEECFTSIRLGEFAKDHCKSLRNKYRKDSEEFHYYSAVLTELEAQGYRCCMVDDKPARIPNLTNWKPSFKTSSNSFGNETNRITNKNQSGYNKTISLTAETTDSIVVSDDKIDFENINIRLWRRIKTELDNGRSVDWISKNVNELPGNYYSAREVVERLISENLN